MEAPQPPPPQQIKVWTWDDAREIATRIPPVSRSRAHDFLAAWRDGGQYPERHIEDLTTRDAFDWVTYLAGHRYAGVVFGGVGVHKFEIRYLRPYDHNTDSFRCDFVAYRQDGVAVRLHPSDAKEAIPVLVPNIRTLAMDWSSAVDPLPQVGTRDLADGVSVFWHISQNDKLHAKAFEAWLNAEKATGELRDITEPPAGGAPWFSWPLLAASIPRLGFLTQVGVSEVATCRMGSGRIGVMFRRNDNGEVVTVDMIRGNCIVHQNDAALGQVLEVASERWRHHQPPPAPPQGA